MATINLGKVVPKKGVDYFTDEDISSLNIPRNTSELTNDSSFVSETYVTNAIANAQLGGDSSDIDLSGYATKDDLINKVDKVTGKSLISDTEIERLASITNYDDTEIKNTLNTKANASDILTDYNQLTNQPSVNDVVLSGNKTLEDLGAVPITEEELNIMLSNEIINIEPIENDIPKVFINGDIPTTKNYVLAKLEYISKTSRFNSFIKIKCQGTSSMSYPKKNFTISLFSDEDRTIKLKKNFKSWGDQNKFCLKANYIDHSHARNIVSANLWSEVVSSRNNYEDLPEELKASPNNGAIDGFPIKIYTNGTYQGIYTWNIPKDDWLYNMDSDNANHVLLCAETNTDGIYAENACNFRALWNGNDGSNWSIEVGTNSDALKTSLNNLITCVKDTDDETFKTTLNNYLDVNSAIDYYLHQYVICGLDGLAKNMLLATYDGTKWYCGAYDMDSTFGLFWNGTSFVATDYQCPEQYQEQFSLLWERIESLFTTELKQRYAQLRNTVYSLENMFTKFERFIDLIGNDLYKEDVTIYTGIPSNTTNNITQIRNYIRDRLTYVDEQVNAMGG